MTMKAKGFGSYGPPCRLCCTARQEANVGCVRNAYTPEMEPGHGSWVNVSDAMFNLVLSFNMRVYHGIASTE